MEKEQVRNICSFCCSWELALYDTYRQSLQPGTQIKERLRKIKGQPSLMHLLMEGREWWQFKWQQITYFLLPCKEHLTELQETSIDRRFTKKKDWTSVRIANSILYIYSSAFVLNNLNKNTISLVSFHTSDLEEVQACLRHEPTDGKDDKIRKLAAASYSQAVEVLRFAAIL